MPSVPEPGPAIACSLDGQAYRERAGEWRRALDGAEVTLLPDGARSARLPSDRADEVIRLVVAEQRCCPFLSFRTDVEGGSLTVTVRAPGDAAALAAALFEPAADTDRPC